ncbi:MAG TPA: hypothetical protein VLZ81_11285, partial [Blastocatellia bacterium]|nr:hypothetical protein [Blastocatellia bacterium]
LCLRFSINFGPRPPSGSGAHQSEGIEFQYFAMVVLICCQADYITRVVHFNICIFQARRSRPVGLDLSEPSPRWRLKLSAVREDPTPARLSDCSIALSEVS